MSQYAPFQIVRRLFLAGVFCSAVFNPSFLLSFQQAETSRDRILNIQKLAKWLVKYTNPETGLPFSHVGDDRVANWCFTYDAAITAQSYMQIGKIDKAEKIIDYFMTRKGIWRLGGIINAVDAANPRLSGKGTEWVVHSGPNIHLAIASFQIYLKTANEKYLAFAEQLADFISSLQNGNKRSVNLGAIRMGPLGQEGAKDQRVGWNEKAPSWHEIYCTEHNVDAWALYHMLYNATGKTKYQISRNLVFRWLKTVAYNKEGGYFIRGCIENDGNVGFEGMDIIAASDVQFWMISALGSEELNKIEPNLAERLMMFTEDDFEVEVEYTRSDGTETIVKGFDYIDHRRREEIRRKSVVTPEWTSSGINAYRRLSADAMSFGCLTQNSSLKVERYQKKSEEFINNIVGMASEKDKMLYLPYATSQDMPTGHGWNTPRCHQSAISNAYLILAMTSYDPFIAGSGQAVDRIKTKVDPILEMKRDGMLLTSSEDYIVLAWKEVKANHWQEAGDVAQKMIARHPDWVDIAKSQSVNLTKQLNLSEKSIREKTEEITKWWASTEKENVFKNWALNDLGAAYFMLLKKYLETNQKEKAFQCAVEILQNYNLALIWDPKGWFWNPTMSMRNEMPELYNQAANFICAMRKTPNLQTFRPPSPTGL